MVKSVLYLILPIIIIILIGCDPNNDKYSFHAYDEGHVQVASGTFTMHLKSGQVSGSVDVNPKNFLNAGGSDRYTGQIEGTYTDTTIEIDVIPYGQDFGVYLIGVFDGDDISGDILYLTIGGTSLLARFTLSPK